MGNAFDLVVIGAGNTGQNAGRQHGIPDKVILSCSRPVLIVPSNTSESVSQSDEILSTLARHDVVAEIVYSNAREGLFHQDEIGTELLDIANDYGADMLIMGAYSHNRLGQQVLGGTTRTILDNMNLPVMMCH